VRYELAPVDRRLFYRVIDSDHYRGLPTTEIRAMSNLRYYPFPGGPPAPRIEVETFVHDVADARNELSDCINTFNGMGVQELSPELYDQLDKIIGLFDEALDAIGGRPE
jgi:hypothetical protein